MNLVEVVVRFHPYVGGVENTVHHLSRQLVARGHRVTVVCAAEPAGPAEVGGVRVVRLPYRAKLGNTNLSRGVVSAVTAARPDLVHTHLPTAWWADAAALAGRRLGVPLVLTYNNDLVGEGGKGILARVYNRHLLPRLLAAADRIVVPNPAYPSPWLPPVRSRTLSIPWGVDAAAFRPVPLQEVAPLVVGFLAILDEHHRYKGLEELLAAGRDLARRGVPFRFEVGGRGAREEAYRRRAAELGIDDRVRFRGFVPQAELPAFYAGCHAFALPSTDARQEGFGLVLVEAMACGRAVVTTPVVGMAAAIEEAGAGVLVPPGSPVALADALARLAADPAGLRAMGERARRLVEERFAWERVTDAYERLFEELVTRGPESAPAAPPAAPAAGSRRAPPGRGPGRRRRR